MKPMYAHLVRLITLTTTILLMIAHQFGAPPDGPGDTAQLLHRSDRRPADYTICGPLVNAAAKPSTPAGKKSFVKK